MGGRVDVTLYAESEDTAETAARAAFGRFAELEDVFSDYRPASELMRLCAMAGAGPVRVSRPLFEVLAYSLQVSKATGGAFDVTASPVIRLWRTARQTGKLPSDRDRLAALMRVGWRHVLLDPISQTVELELPGMQLDLGGIAKGYSCDAAIAVLRQKGIARAMVEAGGDIAFSGPPPGIQGWTVRVRGLADTFVLRDGAMSTSGDTEQFVEIGGVRYSHVVDPRTGMGVTTRAQATVVSSTGLVTDPLATALCVDPGLEASLERFGQAQALVTTVKG